MAYPSESLTKGLPSAVGMTFGIVVSEWNREITEALLRGAVSRLKQAGANEKNIIIRHVPGSFEIPLGAQLMAENYHPDAVICLGCVIQGETRHFDYICLGVTRGVADLNLKYNKPFIYGVLTTSNIDQARQRAGGQHGNKGDEAAAAAIRMVSLIRDMEHQ
jgi:6,7-dimethyl-8-ribityllumazine synthase